MIPTCYTVRPGPDSGWVTFFELARSAESQGFFLIIGPGGDSRPDPDKRRLAQEVARTIVTSFKSRRGEDPVEWLKQLRYQVTGASPRLEFGALLLTGEEMIFVCEGRVRVYPLTATARFRWERDIPSPGVVVRRRVEAGDRFFFGRVPQEAATGLPAADVLERVERAGGRDGALIITFLPSGEPASVGEMEGAAPPPAPSEPELPVIETPTPSGQHRATTPAPRILSAEEILTEAPPAAAVPLESDVATPVGEPVPTSFLEAPIAEAGPELSAGDLASSAWIDAGEREAVPPRWPWVLLAISVVSLVGYLAFIRPMVRGRTKPAREESVTTAPESTAAPMAAAPPEGGAGTAWQTQLSGAVTGTPLVLADRLIVAARDGSVTALDRRSGARLWSLTSPKGFGGGPVMADSLVVVAGFDGIVRGIDPDDGRAVWQFATGGRIASTPAVTREGAVVVGSYDRTLYGLQGRNGRLLWKCRLGGILWASPVAAGAYVYAAGLDGTVAAVNGKWGSVLWRFPAKAEIYSAPAVTRQALVFGAEDGSVYAIDPETGRLLWKFAAGSPVGGGVAVEDDLFVMGDDGGVVHALEGSSGREVWRAGVGGAVKARPLIDAGGVVIAGHDGGLHALRLASGERIGRFPVGSPMAAAPAVAGDTLFVGTHDGRVVALRLR